MVSVIGTRGAQATTGVDLRIGTKSGAMYANCVGLQPKGCRVRDPRVISWRNRASYACERRYQRRRNRYSCDPHRTVRPHRPWRASSSHVRSIPREMRPKRYLPQESNQIWSRLPRFGQIFFSPRRDLVPNERFVVISS
jgi:hypothetical protein